MLNKIKNNIEQFKLILPNQPVVVGFSGGADSACLVYCLNQLGYKVFAVHVEHGIRGEEALRDADFADKFCKKYGVKCYVEHINVPEISKNEKLSHETAARRERYKILNQYATALNAPIAVAHNKNDQAETVLMHLIRGSGLNGLCGMQIKTGNVIRPLLNVSHKEIELFAQNNNIEYINDSTNFSLDYNRNKVRLEIIPKLEEINASAVDSIFNCSNILQDYSTYFSKNAESYFKELATVNDNRCTLKIAKNVDEIIFLELIKKALIALNGNLVDIEKKHLFSIFELCNKESGKEIFLPKDIKVKRVYDNLVFFFDDEGFSADYEFFPEKSYKWDNGYVLSKFTDFLFQQNRCEHIDFDALPKGARIRTRQSGDYIYPIGLGGKTTLKKYFINKKIPIDKRNSIPLLAVDNEVLAILGYTVSEKVKITDNTKRILKIFQGDVK